MLIDYFTFNPFSENTYVVSDESSECVIIDPGCHSTEEKKLLLEFIQNKKLRPVRLLNTHCHIDHVLGNRFVSDTFKLKLEMNKLDIPVLHSLSMTSKMYGIQSDPSPEPEVFLDEGSLVNFGNSTLEILFTPGHSPGSIVFYNRKEKFAISGDVLFLKSIGRYDFPGGDYETLMNSIRMKLFLLDDDTKIYPGHGPATTIGFEKTNNPFLSS